MSQQQYKLARFAKYGPPPMTQEDKVKQEKGFVLDAVAVSTLSDDSGRANPKMATAIPPYNAQKDRHSKGYFEKPVVRKLLTKTEQVIISFILNCGACLIIKWCRYAYNRCFIMFIQATDLHSADSARVLGKAIFNINHAKTREEFCQSRSESESFRNSSRVLPTS